MAKIMSISALFGVTFGAAISAYAHSGNGFQTGPLVLLALCLSASGTVGTGILMLVGKRGQPIAAVGAFSAAILVSLIVLPLMWPYSAPATPTSIDGRPGSVQPK